MVIQQYLHVTHLYFEQRIYKRFMIHIAYLKNSSIHGQQRYQYNSIKCDQSNM